MYDVLHLHCLPGAILLSCMMSYTLIAYMAFWCPVLSEINDVKIFLQTPGLGLDSWRLNLGLLSSSAKRNAKTSLKRQRRRIRLSARKWGYQQKQGCGGEDEWREKALKMPVCHYSLCLRREQQQIIDRLHGEIRNRTNHMMDVNDKFGFLTNMGRLMDSANDEGIDSAIDRLTPTSTSPLK